MELDMSARPAPQDTTGLPHDNLQVNIIVCAATTWVISVVFVGLRFYTRRAILNVLGPSDWCILASLLFSGAFTGSVIEQVYHGEGKHVYDIKPEDLFRMRRAGWYGVLFYFLSLLFTKLAILLLFLTVLSYHWVKVATKIVLGIVIASSIFSIGSIATACVPLDAFWDSSKKGYCHPGEVWWANTGMFIVTDILIYLLPIPVTLNLRLPKKQKYTLIGVFAIGFFAVLASMLRLISLVRTQIGIGDFTYAGTFLTYWTTLEVNVCIVVACLMTLSPLVRRLFPRSFEETPPHPPIRISVPLTIGSLSTVSPVARTNQKHWADVLDDYDDDDDEEQPQSWKRDSGWPLRDLGAGKRTSDMFDIEKAVIAMNEVAPTTTQTAIRPPPNLNPFLDSTSAQTGGPYHI